MRRGRTHAHEKDLHPGHWASVSESLSGSQSESGSIFDRNLFSDINFDPDSDSDTDRDGLYSDAIFEAVPKRPGLGSRPKAI